MERGAEKAERAAHQYNLKELYIKTKLLCDKSSPQRKKCLKVENAVL